MPLVDGTYNEVVVMIVAFGFGSHANIFYFRFFLDSAVAPAASGGVAAALLVEFSSTILMGFSSTNIRMKTLLIWHTKKHARP